MTHRRSLLASPGAWLASVSLAVALTVSMACGGGGSDDSISEEEATEAANHYLATALGLFTGTTEAQEFIDLFAPECREDADPSALAVVMLLIQGFAPELQGIEVEAVNVGELVREETAEGVLVTPRDPSALRIKVDGEWVAAADFFGEAGFEAAEDEDLADPLLLVQRDGKIYIGDCSELQDLSGGLDTSLFPDVGLAVSS